MATKNNRVTLKRDGTVRVDGCDVGWRWRKIGGFHPEYWLLNGNQLKMLSDYNRSKFCDLVAVRYDSNGVA